MKKSAKIIIALSLTLIMMVGLTVTSFASSGTTVSIKSYEGFLNDCVSITNIARTGGYDHFDDGISYYSSGPVEVTSTKYLTSLYVYRAEPGNNEWELVEMLPVDGTAVIWDIEGVERTINYRDLFNYEIDSPPDLLPGARAVLKDPGVYAIYADLAPYADYIAAVVVIEGAAKIEAVPTASKVLVDGKEISFDAYNINGNNYFKLRDVAMVISGSAKQFEVTWDAEKNAINLVSGRAYTPVGGELAKGTGTINNIGASTATIYLNGKPVTLTAYNINGNNYFKLRDLGEAFNFNVSWDGVNNTVKVDTTESYTND